MDKQLRYSAGMALDHPWITRKFDSPIPMSIYEEALRNQMNSELLKVFRCVFFTSIHNEPVLDLRKI